MALDCKKSFRIADPVCFSNGQINGLLSYRLHTLLHGGSIDLFMFTKNNNGIQLVRFTGSKKTSKFNQKTHEVSLDLGDILQFFDPIKTNSSASLDKLFVQRPPALVDDGKTLIFSRMFGGHISLYESR